MSSYRFCRTDDIGLLVDALNRCWAPYFPDQPPETPATFKRSIRDLQVWCSSCMVAFAGPDPVGVLIGAKRPSGTLIHRIAVHPEHVRQGHGRHLLTSLSSKLAILGPPRIVAEVPEALAPGSELFRACGYVQEAVLTDYLLPAEQPEVRDLGRQLLVPMTVEDLAANGLLGDTDRQVCWQRSAESLTARKDAIAGLAIATDERIEACILYIEDELLLLRSFFAGGAAHLKLLLSRAGSTGSGTFRFAKVHPAEISKEMLELLRVRPAGRHLLFAGKARSG